MHATRIEASRPVSNERASVGLPAGYLLRPPQGGEASEIDRLSAAVDAALDAPATLTEHLIRRMWNRPRFDLQTDAWIVEHRGMIFGYAQVWAESPEHMSGFTLVDPEHTGLGIGSALAGLIEGRVAEQAVGAAQLFIATIQQDEAATRLLAARGYEFARRFWQMEVELDSAPQPAEPPAGIRLKPLAPEQDLPAAHRVLEDALADHWDWTPTSYEDFLVQNVRQEDFDPSLWLVALDADEPVGLLTGSASADRGAVDMVGVIRSHRGRGIASAMLREAFAEFRRRGLGRARLNVDSENPTGAVSVYERAGMQVVASYDLWRRTIQGRP